MANKSNKKKREDSRSRLTKAGRIMAIIMIIALVVTFTLMTGLFAFN